MSNQPDVSYHQDAELFRSALQFTTATTGFGQRLIEKDYHCSVVLSDICSSDAGGLVFKGGTCLSKVHADFSRLSEDLDFGISTLITSSRSERSQSLAKVKRQLGGLPARHASLRIAEPLQGHNNSTQYGGRLAYTSVISGQEDFIKIEISVREPIIESGILLPARTMLLDPFRGTPAVAAFQASVLSLREAYAEKLRAALTREQPAIRDFYDVDQAFSTGRVDLADSQMVQLLRAKLAVPGNRPMDVGLDKFHRLRAQIESQLRPVLRAQDLERFDLNRAFDYVVKAAQLAGP